MHRSKLVLSLLATLVVALAASQSHAQTLTTLASFNGTNGESPRGDLTLSGSTLYGMTTSGGANSDGTIFSIPVTGGTPTTLFNFDGTNGANPNGSLTLIGSTLYGTTSGGGVNNDGTIFSIPVTGGTPTTLLSFNGLSNGQNPLGDLTLIGSTLYGTTKNGGVNGGGTIFSIPVTGGAPMILQSFGNGTNLSANLTPSADGSTLYGMTGDNAFSIPTNGGTLTTLPTYGADIGSGSGLTLSADGSTLYGMSGSGGINNNFDLGADGNIFSIPVTGNSGISTLFDFFNPFNTYIYPDGAHPNGSLTLSADGSTLYGMTSYGGYYNGGNIFSISATGGNFTTLINFNGQAGYGVDPLGSLTLSGSTLYGMTLGGGANGDGTVFALNLVPEPSSVVLLGLGAIGLGVTAFRRRMRKRAA